MRVTISHPPAKRIHLPGMKLMGGYSSLPDIWLIFQARIRKPSQPIKRTRSARRYGRNWRNSMPARTIWHSSAGFLLEARSSSRKFALKREFTSKRTCPCQNPPTFVNLSHRAARPGWTDSTRSAATRSWMKCTKSKT